MSPQISAKDAASQGSNLFLELVLRGSSGQFLPTYSLMSTLCHEVGKDSTVASWSAHHRLLSIL